MLLNLPIKMRFLSFYLHNRILNIFFLHNIQNNMIKSFKHKGLENFYNTGSTKGIQEIHADKISRILTVLDNITSLNDLSAPAYKLYQLKGDLKGLVFQNLL